MYFDLKVKILQYVHSMFLKGHISESNYMDTLMQQTVKSFPNATIRVAVPPQHRFKLKHKNIFIDHIIDKSLYFIIIIYRLCMYRYIHIQKQKSSN